MILDKFDLTGKTAIVTGAGTGLGRAMALAMADAGCDIYGAARRIEPLEETKRLVEAKGRRMEIRSTDVTVTAEVNDMVNDAIAQFGRVDILINNAGIIGRDVPVKDLSEADWDRVLDINLKGTFLCSRAVLPTMLAQKKGAIVSTASISGKEGNPNMAPYSVSKAGIICFTKALAKEVIHDGIRVNCVAPALIETPLIANVEPEQRAYMTSKIPMGRLGHPDEVAAVIQFLASDESSFVTGQCYDVSGGRATY